jgi:hypothetical protein
MQKFKESQWKELQDAYGNASVVPSLLEQVISNKSLKSDPQSGPWFELWSRLYHQGSIYTASYASVIVLAEAMKGVSGRVAMDFFLLPASIELARKGDNSPSLPSEMEADYRAAIKELGAVAGNYVDESEDPYLGKAARAMQLVSEGKIEEANDLIDS